MAKRKLERRVTRKLLPRSVVQGSRRSRSRSRLPPVEPTARAAAADGRAGRGGRLRPVQRYRRVSGGG